jgi:hypothetical protein
VRPEGGRRVVGTHRILRSLPAAMADSGERLLGPGSAIGRGKKGEEERRLRPSYRRGRATEGAGE